MRSPCSGGKSLFEALSLVFCWRPRIWPRVLQSDASQSRHQFLNSYRLPGTSPHFRPVSTMAPPAGDVATEAPEKRQANVNGDEPKISASERRRLRKAEQAAAKKDSKQQQQEGNSSPAVNNKAQKPEEELDPTQYFEKRCHLVQDLQRKGVPAYPHKFQVTLTIPEFIKMYGGLGDGEHLENEEVQIAGRISRVSASGQKLRFYDIRGDGEKIQVMSNFSYHDEKAGDFSEVHNRFRRGDVIGIRGFPGKSKRGELSIFPREVTLLSPCLHMLPERNSLKDFEVRFRHRYLDLMVNDETRKTFLIRSRIVNYLRRFLEDRGFVEVETPMMNVIAGGAAARPFKTHHNDLDMDLYMRIAPELFLKMLIVGGMDRVFEIGKNFRNEGIDMTHNPEFTACEFYWAYADYNDLMNFTEELVSSMVMALHGTYQIQFHPDGPGSEPVTLDFTPPFARLSMVEEIEKQAGVTLPRPLDGDECIAFMKELLIKNKVDLPQPATSAKLLDALCGEYVECQARTKPVFITEHPQIMSPLAKWHRSKPELTERFELFLMGKELCNAYTELNDPVRQRECFMDQAKAKAAGDDEATCIDEVFCTALEYGLPPTGGWGIGIDRLTMFLSDHNTIKEVILFPAMRPQPLVGIPGKHGSDAGAPGEASAPAQ
uniref:Lysine--tRNA ligase n=1 Tax=Toxoplasma gondii COUG TaxID=1074873 RepID=A0A2G8Y513_TOXGO|nr:lysine-tRNA ligase [Toxoplasma gondii COUG]